MSTVPSELTPQLIDAIATRLKAGGFEQVAVESLGLDWEQYQEWLRRGKRPFCPGVYRLLNSAVIQARAQARLKVEMDMRELFPKIWLLNGPGRATATQEGWGAAAKFAPAAGDAADNAKVLDLCAVVLKALTPFPEARAAVATALKQWQSESAERKATEGQQ